MLARDAIAQVRSYMTGSLVDELTVLAEPYDPATDSEIVLRYPKKAVGSGSTICVGLNTCIVVGNSTDGTTLQVMAGVDGGPQVRCSAGEFVRVKPQFTSWAVYRELANEIQNLSASGLYFVDILETATIDRVSGMYQIPTRADGLLPYRLLKAEYQIAGTSIWQRIAEAEYQTATSMVRVFCDAPGVIAYRFHMAYPFGALNNDLSQDLTTIGVYDRIQNIPLLGAASTMALGWEGRRNQPSAQGDTRRPTEVQVGSNTGLSRMFASRQQAEITNELEYLTRLYGWQMSIATGASARFGAGTGWR